MNYEEQFLQQYQNLCLTPKNNGTSNKDDKIKEFPEIKDQNPLINVKEELLFIRIYKKETKHELEPQKSNEHSYKHIKHNISKNHHKSSKPLGDSLMNKNENFLHHKIKARPGRKKSNTI